MRCRATWCEIPQEALALHYEKATLHITHRWIQRDPSLVESNGFTEPASLTDNPHHTANVLSLKHIANSLIDFKYHIGRKIPLFALMLIKCPIRREVPIIRRRFSTHFHLNSPVLLLPPAEEEAGILVGSCEVVVVLILRSSSSFLAVMRIKVSWRVQLPLRYSRSTKGEEDEVEPPWMRGKWRGCRCGSGKIWGGGSGVVGGSDMVRSRGGEMCVCGGGGVKGVGEVNDLQHLGIKRRQVGSGECGEAGLWIHVAGLCKWRCTQNSN
ncbi:uncharacterized protein G2W53_036313 [Senna tora]|uniref:Uncharacterized protein n=1 Tax=Senna tora TaxID=362788 RepID=A0A834W4P8_9FABA|nr:uncharacterized protein G2W53_036313 [Senna tora]